MFATDIAKIFLKINAIKGWQFQPAWLAYTYIFVTIHELLLYLIEYRKSIGNNCLESVQNMKNKTLSPNCLPEFFKNFCKQVLIINR